MSAEILNDLAKRISHRSLQINCAHAHSEEERAVRRSMVVIFGELAEMIQESERKAKKAELLNE